MDSYPGDIGELGTDIHVAGDKWVGQTNKGGRKNSLEWTNMRGMNRTYDGRADRRQCMLPSARARMRVCVAH